VLQIAAEPLTEGVGGLGGVGEQAGAEASSVKSGGDAVPLPALGDAFQRVYIFGGGAVFPLFRQCFATHLGVDMSMIHGADMLDVQDFIKAVENQVNFRALKADWDAVPPTAYAHADTAKFDAFVNSIERGDGGEHGQPVHIL